MITTSIYERVYNTKGLNCGLLNLECFITTKKAISVSNAWNVYGDLF